VLSKGHILAIFVIIVTLFSSMNVVNAETATYQEHRFYIEYPLEWSVSDNWNTRTSEVLFKGDFREKIIISVAVKDKYELADLYEKRSIEISKIDQELLNVVTGNIKKECDMNLIGQCWNYKLLDSKIITIDNEKAISIKFEAHIDDLDSIVKIILLPDNQNLWVIKGKVSGNKLDFEDEVEKTIQTFRLESKIESETQEKPSIFVRSITSTDPDIVLEKNLNVNLILVGDTWSSSEKSSITNGLSSFYDPIVVSTEKKAGIRYNYQYNFVSASEQQTKNLAKHMVKNSNVRPIWGSDIFEIPLWQAYWAELYHPSWDVSGQYRSVDAIAIEEFLYETIIGPDQSLTKPNSVNLIFLKTDLDDVDYLHNYFLNDVDKATGGEHSYFGLMGYGGNYNMFFFDLYAVPWIDFDRQTFEHTLPTWVKSLHDCSTDQCFRELVIFHTKSSLSHIITPSFLYPIENYEKYFVDIVVYDVPGKTGLTSQALTKFINEEQIKEEFENLFPFSEWEIQSSIESRESRGITYDFKDQLKGSYNEIYETPFGETRSVKFLQSEKIQPYLLEWADSRIEELKVNSKTTWHIPVLVVVGDSEQHDIFLDDFGVTGFAPGRIDDDTIPCCAFGVTNEKNVWNDKIGITV